MTRVVSAAALALVLSVISVGARADWRDHGDWRWRHHPHHYRPSPEVIMVYPAPPPVVYAPSPQVVYVEPEPVQVIPTSPPYNDAGGRYCREYQSTVVVAGQVQPSYGTACLMPDGQWRIVR